ncbi:hypothetical protein [Pontibacter akesuensis]|uniref:Lipocalin-like domain-containing protein n=1 Tax=Pontibacter akesuensis TaxID=388950 RepID=A0A1I7K805_9BACT|nr:hypothetical protein [Pontibacter akesuensis]GHA74443.1 hypothetical protein GCM10007389_30210 [Pontibacter akesuensis]SFU93492.1 hypothetical protein SAMN04487941_3486 [Pontibacter akesuensis]
MKLYVPLLALLILTTLAGFTFSSQQNHYSIVGQWKLVDMQIGNNKKAKARSGIKKSIAQNEMRLVFEESGQFMMALDADGRGLRGGYYYDTTSQVLSITYGAHTDTALVSWEGANRMVHSTTDGQTKTIMERVTE